jgi:polysaccharide export outer membrane protein
VSIYTLPAILKANHRRWSNGYPIKIHFMKPMSTRAFYSPGLNFYVLTATIYIITILSSCASNKRISYFKDIPDSIFLAARNINTASFEEPVIQPNDILQVSILSLDPQLNNMLTSANSAVFSVQPSSANLPTTAPSISGFLVDKKGMIELPVAGKIKVAGLSTAQARDFIHDRVAIFYRDPVINVRFANFNITVLGEVARPATYIVPNEKLSVLDAIGMAGDLTIYGKRENVLLVRDSAGQKKYVRFDLNSSNMFNSPYFYLRQGDVIYVEPGKSKIAASDGVRNRNITLVASGLSLLIVFFSKIL